MIDDLKSFTRASAICASQQRFAIALLLFENHQVKLSPTEATTVKSLRNILVNFRDIVGRLYFLKLKNGKDCHREINNLCNETHELQNKMVCIDVGLNHFYTDNDGNQVENPRFLRKGEKALKGLNRRLHRKQTGSKNRANARNRLGPKHLKVSRFSIRLLREGSKEAMPVSRFCSVRGLKRAKYG